jgi:hypothetical protein
MMTTMILSPPAADAAGGLGLDPDYRTFRQSISSSAKLSAVTIYSNVKLDTVDVPKSSDGNELWSQKIWVIFEAMGVYKIVVSSIDSSPLLHLRKRSSPSSSYSDKDSS